jgi:hypothetical protein
MGTPDGKIFVPSSSSFRKVDCSRWEELGETLRWHGATAAALGARTEFRLLNAPRGAPQRVVVGGGPDDAAALRDLEKVIKSSPGGYTPLCAALGEVVAEIRAAAPALRAAGKVVTVIVASDGEASDGDVARALQPLVGQPCCVVVRLCTDDDRVAKYWNNIDADLELELDVLDDLAGEGGEVFEHSPWLAYAEPLHRTREWGAAPKLFDLLDERAFSPREAAEMLGLILGPAARGLPDPSVEPDAYSNALAPVLATAGRVYSAHRNAVVAWCDLAVLTRRVLRPTPGGGAGLLAAFPALPALPALGNLSPNATVAVVVFACIAFFHAFILK